jgi:hypothetical protein
VFECLILGDSIALGTAWAINSRSSVRCDVVAEQGATVDRLLTWTMPLKVYGSSIVCVGSNDLSGLALSKKLTRLRLGIRARRVIWLLPYSRSRALAVRSVAVTFGDEALDLVRFDSRDGVHPVSYPEVARTLLR